MRNALVFGWLSLSVLTATATAQQTTIDPQVRTKPTADSKITAIELAAHFVTTIRVPEPVNSVVVGDPALFQVEHSEHEPELVFVKALTNEHAESNLLISTAKGRQISFLLVSRGDGPNSAKVDFLLRYQPSGGFLVEPDAVPSTLVAQTA
ncbi:MAG: type-F conjugative transfer system secretin TraK, partial [Candidatus Korobacteraceae bacterium]